MPVTVLVAPGPEVTMTTPTLPVARIAVGLVHRALLMTGEHMMQLLAVVERIVDLDGLAARIAEDQVDALGLERGHHGLRADHLFALFGVFAAQTAGLACGGRVLILLAARS